MYAARARYRARIGQEAMFPEVAGGHGHRVADVIHAGVMAPVGPARIVAYSFCVDIFHH
jgi:hypothetical protein